MSVELWLVRHGETDWNVEGRIQGHTDIPLNNTGVMQAQNLVKEIKHNSFDAIFCSDLQRAQMTASTLAKNIGLTPVVDERLREINRGMWQGELLVDIREKFADQILLLKQDPLHYAVPGGESPVEVATRMWAVADEIADAYHGGRVLVVSHGYALAMLIASVKGVSIEKARSLIPGNSIPVVIHWVKEIHSLQ